jgi:hypothetical protein
MVASRVVEADQHARAGGVSAHDHLPKSAQSSGFDFGRQFVVFLGDGENRDLQFAVESELGVCPILMS